MELKNLYKRNTNPNLYVEEENGHNCGSFALNIDGWYCPYIQSFEENISEDDVLWQYEEVERINWIEELVADGHDREEIMEVVTARDFEFILKTCPWLVPIDEDEIDSKDRVIAYRLSMEIPNELEEFDVDENMDFHFRVLIGGEWWEKNGAGPVHKVIDPDCDVWEVEEWLVYDGPIKYARFVHEEN
jgi:hypothetical protein